MQSIRGAYNLTEQDIKFFKMQIWGSYNQISIVLDLSINELLLLARQSVLYFRGYLRSVLCHLFHSPATNARFGVHPETQVKTVNALPCFYSARNIQCVSVGRSPYLI